MFIFDTDIYTNVVRKIPSEKLLDRLKKIPRRDQFTTTITIAEVYYGVMKASNRTRLLGLFEAVLLPRATILPFSFLAAKKYGKIRSFLAKQGTLLAHADLQIATIALSMNMTLVTANLKHFQRIPQLTVENWLI
ncbi:MAG: PIN domain-containing protein [Deltaproteobacteria bacterium]|nr:PIN domain-containing protein [Deltaproteobacteria bacterium]